MVFGKNRKAAKFAQDEAKKQTDIYNTQLKKITDVLIESIENLEVRVASLEVEVIKEKEAAANVD